jgi:hypothetical protein
MTKLENAKILDMVNGEPIRIEYDGIVYDLVPKIGGYDEHGNVKEAPKFEVGDYAKVIEPGYCGDIEVGSIVKITNPKDDDGHYQVELLDGSDYDWFADDQLEKVAEEEIAQAKAKFEVGDYVKVLASDNGFAEKGDIAKITEIDESCSIPYKLELIGGEYGGWQDEETIIKATDEEVAQAKAKAERKREEARWAKIGRKPGEFKKGDIVRYLGGAPTKKGELVEVYEDTSGTTTKIKWVDDYGVCTERNDDLELVTPVEQRFDIAAEPKAGVHQ